MDKPINQDVVARAFRGKSAQRNQDIYRMRHDEHRTYKEIGDKHNISGKRAHQIYQCTERTIKQFMTRQDRVHEFLTSKFLRATPRRGQAAFDHLPDDTPIQILLNELQTRVQHGIINTVGHEGTIGDVRKLTDRDWLKMQNFGRTSLKELRTYVTMGNDNFQPPSISLIDALKATLLFFDGGPWTKEKTEAWKAITGRDECSSRYLCEHIRQFVGVEDWKKPG